MIGLVPPSIAADTSALVELARTVAYYEQYVRQTREALYEAYYRRTLDQRAASHFANSAMQQLRLLEPVTSRLGIGLYLVDELEAMEEARAALGRFMR